MGFYALQGLDVVLVKDPGWRSSATWC